MTPTQQDSPARPAPGAGHRDGRSAPAAEYALDPAAVSARFRQARRQGRPFWLWPDVAVADWRAALAALERIAAAVLRGDRPSYGAPAGVGGTAALGVAAYTSGLGPWLGRLAEDGVLSVDADTAALFAAHLDHGRRRAAMLSTELKSVLDTLAATGARATVLKGMHTASVYFAEPGLRPMADIDVVVEAGTLARSERALAAAGYVEDEAARLVRPQRSEWRRPGIPRLPQSLSLVHADDPWTVDLHGTMDIDFFGVRTVRFSQPPAQACVAAPALGAHATVLREPLLAAHLAVHASHGLHGLTLIRLVELALVLRADMRTAADWEDFAELLRQLDAERFAFPALALVDRLAPGLIPPALLVRVRQAAPRRLCAVIDGLRPAAAQRIDGLALDERFMWAATPVEHLRRLGNMLVPTGTGPVRRLGRIYADRVFRIARGRVSLRGHTDG
jgi:hypothetical protein